MADKRKYLLIEGQGAGCDYTIGCGKRVTKIEAANDHEAMTKAAERIGVENWRARNEYGRQADYAIESATLVLVDTDLDVEAYMAALVATWKEETASRKQRETEAKERAELDRLQAKFAKEASRG